MPQESLLSLIIIVFSLLIVIIILSLLSRCSMYLKKILAELKDLNKRLTISAERELLCPVCKKTFPEKNGKEVEGKILCPLCAANDITITLHNKGN